MKKIYVKLLVTTLMFTFLLYTAGCGKDLSPTASALLQQITGEFIYYGGFDAENRLVTIDISDFSQYSTDDYVKWVMDTYTNKNTVIVVYTDQDKGFSGMSEAKEYLQNNGYESFLLTDFDWTNIKISRENGKQRINPTIKCVINISYPSIFGMEGFEMKLKYKDETWSVVELKQTYIS